jgi:hypothetical protein
MSTKVVRVIDGAVDETNLICISESFQIDDKRIRGMLECGASTTGGIDLNIDEEI